MTLCGRIACTRCGLGTHPDLILPSNTLPGRQLVCATCWAEEHGMPFQPTPGDCAMTPEELEAIKNRYKENFKGPAEYSYFLRYALSDIPALLARIADLEHDLATWQHAAGEVAQMDGRK